MIVLEKILLLRSVTFFKEIPDDLLLQIVTTSVTEEIVAAGDAILKKNDKGRNMYIIASGRVSIHDENIIFKELGEREIFGELAALSFGRRLASASALTECLLLKISSTTLYQLMDVDIGMAKGIIKALCERTESINRQLEAAMQNQGKHHVAPH